MEIIRNAAIVEFDVIYDDGTRSRVREGVLWSVEDDAITFHNGTSRVNVLFAAIEDAIKLVGYMGLIGLLADYLLSPPCSAEFKKLLDIAQMRNLSISDSVKDDANGNT